MRRAAPLSFGLVAGLILLALWWAPPREVPPAWAQGVGIFSRATCTQINSPIVGQTWCFDQAANVLKYWTGSMWVSGVATQTGVANVRDFGAATTSSNNAAAFQAALDSGAPIVWCPGGRYTFTSGLTLRRAVALLGPNTSSTPADSGAETKCVLDHNYAGDFITIVGSASDINASSGYRIEHLMLNQIHGSGSGASGRGIVATVTDDNTKPSWVRLRNLNIEQGAGANDWTWGITFDGTGGTTCLRNAWIEDTRIVASSSSSGALELSNACNVFLSNNMYNAANAVVSISGTGARPSQSVFITGDTGGTLALDQASSIVVTGGAWTTLTTTANSTDVAITGANLTNTPILSGTRVNYQGLIGATGNYTYQSTAVLIATQSGLNVRPGLTVLNAGAESRLTMGDNAGAAGFSSVVLNSTSGKFGYLVGVQNNIDNGLEITPSTAVGGTSFTTPALRILSDGGLGVGNPTGGSRGAGTLNIASATYLNGLPASVASATGQNVQSVRGLSASQSLSNNLRGTCTFSASSVCTVAFANNEPDAHYFVVGTSCPVLVSGKSKTGFTMTATTGNSNACDWAIFR